MTSLPPASPAFEVAAHSGGDAKRSYVRGMFAAIAPRYDLLNHLLSLNVDRSWRRAAVRRLAWERRPDGTYLDLCAGTLDLAATLARAPGFRGTVLGADFVIPMLVQGKGKAPRARPVGADALTLPFADARFDGAMGASGRRTACFGPAPASWCSNSPHRASRRCARSTCSISGGSSPRSAVRCRNIGTPIPTCQSRCSIFGYEVLTGGICAVHHATR